MALNTVLARADILEMTRVVCQTPHLYMWSSYDAEADVLYINFKKSAVATDSELMEHDIIVRYETDEIIGLTVLHASQRAQT